MVNFMWVLWYISFVITIKGQVGQGRKVGRTIGFPTINIPYYGEEEGIYAGKVFVNDRFVLAAVHLGPRPTFDDDEKPGPFVHRMSRG